MKTSEDLIERHVDLLGGLGALGWGVLTMTWIPDLAEFVSAQIAIPFGLLALTRWYRKLRTRKTEAKTTAS
jgi:hypothetical protein